MAGALAAGIQLERFEAHGGDRVKKSNDPIRTFGSLAAVLEFAIQREVEAADSYGRLAERSSQAVVKALLLDLQNQERKHEEILRDLAAGRLVPLFHKEVPDMKVSDYTVDEPVDAESSLQDLLLFAAKKEAKAAALYTELRARVTDPEHRRLFDFLIQEEREHKFRLEKEYERYVLEEN
jgi:rubrerythrin